MRTNILSMLTLMLAMFITLTIVFSSIIEWCFSGVFLILLCIALHDAYFSKHALRRNYPLIARLRWFFEGERTKIQQYFIEDELNGKPYNHETRADVYQKAKGDVNTMPFGTLLNVYETGYEFLRHSMYPLNAEEIPEPRITIGNNLCRHPYSASIFNTSAVSWGAISDNAVRAVNGGAKLGNFFQNTGEGGLTPYHLENGGDICFQFGTGYFGCGKTVDGKRYFNETEFITTVRNPAVKMIEIKLSQGAKPGHGGILPAAKNTPEIAAARGIKPYTEVVSPPYHTAFHDADSLIYFIDRLRIVSDYKPIGIKMCLGQENEVAQLFYKMSERGIYPDFITIDGAEGGTGAAPRVFSNHVGTPLIDALDFITSQLIKTNLRDKVKVIVSGKISGSFDIIKYISLGADACNAARAFMLSLGCIQARECNMNTCPVGIATQDRKLINGLDPADKKVRVYNYHKSVIKEVKEVMAAMGVHSLDELTPDSVSVRNKKGHLETYENQLT